MGCGEATWMPDLVGPASFFGLMSEMPPKVHDKPGPSVPHIH
jgi:hypothetical protein